MLKADEVVIACHGDIGRVWREGGQGNIGETRRTRRTDIAKGIFTACHRCPNWAELT